MREETSSLKNVICSEQEFSETGMFRFYLGADEVLRQKWGECWSRSCGAETPAVHATDPYYQVTYDHITPVARTLRFTATQREATKEVDPSIP